jgi:hypothetical protein
LRRLSLRGDRNEADKDGGRGAEHYCHDLTLFRLDMAARTRRLCSLVIVIDRDANIPQCDNRPPTYPRKSGGLAGLLNGTSAVPSPA